METDALPAYTALVPMLPVTDVTRTIAFYERLGFRVDDTHTPDGEGAPVHATHGMLAARGVDVGDIEYPPYNTGGEFHVHDPDGYALFIAQAE